MNRTVHLTIATIFHPIFVNLLGLWLLFLVYPQLSYGIPERLKLYMIIFVFVITGILPLILVVVLKVLGKVQSIMLQSKEDRRLPYLITTVLYFFCYYNFLKSNAPQALLSYLLGCCTLVLFVMTVNHFYKISIHMATLGAIFGLLVAAIIQTGNDYRLFLVIILLASGLVGSARMFSKSHNLTQTSLGFVTGALLMFVILLSTNI